uniref:Uncharacterized protein n=1 Tax=Oryza sativa subsp. japonica TaxID=39947 RepID=Q75K73_ORYSJ|nr:hypothetical protein [Oryza sativa Japonica Group]
MRCNGKKIKENLAGGFGRLEQRDGWCPRRRARLEGGAAGDGGSQGLSFIQVAARRLRAVEAASRGGARKKQRGFYSLALLCYTSSAPGGGEAWVRWRRLRVPRHAGEPMTMPMVQNAVAKKPMTSCISITSAYVTARPPAAACL